MVRLIIFLLFFFPCIGIASDYDDVGACAQLSPLNELDPHFYHYRMLLIESVIFDMRLNANVRAIPDFDRRIDLLEYLLGKPVKIKGRCYDD